MTAKVKWVNNNNLTKINKVEDYLWIIINKVETLIKDSIKAACSKTNKWTNNRTKALTINSRTKALIINSRIKALIINSRTKDSITNSRTKDSTTNNNHNKTKYSITNNNSNQINNLIIKINNQINKIHKE